jgi:hypothetical protein
MYFAFWLPVFCGLKFYDKDGAVVLETESFDNPPPDLEQSLRTHTQYLEDGERVIGYRSINLSPEYSTAFKESLGGSEGFTIIHVNF